MDPNKRHKNGRLVDDLKAVSLLVAPRGRGGEAACHVGVINVKETTVT